jgi:hypothetical protein
MPGRSLGGSDTRCFSDPLPFPHSSAIDHLPFKPIHCQMLCLYFHLSWVPPEVRVQISLPYKGPDSKYLRLSGHTVSVLTIQLYNCSRKTAMNNMWINGHGCVPIKLYLYNKNKILQIWLEFCDLLTRVGVYPRTEVTSSRVRMQQVQQDKFKCKV